MASLWIYVILICSLQVLSTVRGENACCSQPCGNGGTCELIPNSPGFQCRCLKDYIGKTCEQKRVCLTDDIGFRERQDAPDVTLAASASSCREFCMNDKRCVALVTRTTSPYSCKLYHQKGPTISTTDKYTRLYYRICHYVPWINKNECESKERICQNNAFCRSINPVGYECVCPKGYGGKHCEYALDVNKCATKTIERHYRSTSFRYKYVYQTDPDSCSKLCITEGSNCMEALRYNQSSTTIRYLCSLFNSTTEHVGLLPTTNTRYKIIRKSCSRIPDGNDCVTNPCQNCGICLDQHKRAECVCHGGFTGELCETKVSVAIINNTLPVDPQCNNQGPANPGEQDGPKFGIMELAVSIVASLLGGLAIALVGCCLYQRSGGKPGTKDNSHSNPAYDAGPQPSRANPSVNPEHIYMDLKH